jgi:hypothetical protein
MSADRRIGTDLEYLRACSDQLFGKASVQYVLAHVASSQPLFCAAFSRPQLSKPRGQTVGSEVAA